MSQVRGASVDGGSGFKLRSHVEFVKEIFIDHERYIPYKTLRPRTRDPKWMTDMLKHERGMK